MFCFFSPGGLCVISEWIRFNHFYFVVMLSLRQFLAAIVAVPMMARLLQAGAKLVAHCCCHSNKMCHDFILDLWFYSQHV